MRCGLATICEAAPFYFTMRRICFILLILPSLSFSQNLVPNPSFEDSIQCPSFASQIDRCAIWYSPTNTTPDYFHACDTDFVDVPDNYRGWQNAHSGDAYVGIASYLESGNNQNLREYVATPLIDTLIKDSTYCIEFYINFANNSFYAIDAIGVYFQPDSANWNTSDNIQVTPQISHTGSILNDTVQWLKLSGTWQANGSEKYLVIGNFFDFENTPLVDSTNQGIQALAYYYIDDVSVEMCNPDTTTGDTSAFIKIPNVFTPNGDGYNDQFRIVTTGYETVTTSVYNRWGQLMWQSNLNSQYWDGFNFVGEKAAEGVYFFVVEAITADGQVQRERGAFQLLR